LLHLVLSGSSVSAFIALKAGSGKSRPDVLLNPPSAGSFSEPVVKEHSLI
jgi:hypothetical protein